MQPLPQRCSLSEAVVFSSDLRLIEQYEARSSWLPPTSEGNELTFNPVKKKQTQYSYTERDTALQVSKPLVSSKTAASSLSKLRPLACQNYGLYPAKTTASCLPILRPLSCQNHSLYPAKSTASILPKLRPLSCQNYGLYSAKTTACILSKLRPLSQIVGVMCVMCI